MNLKLKNASLVLKNKLNIHAHSKYSDGRNTLREMAIAYKANNFACAVLSEHDYSFTASSNKKSNLTEYFNECDSLSNELNYPVIAAIEISIPKTYEECVLIGRDAILNWFKYKDIAKLGDNYYLCWVHPMYHFVHLDFVNYIHSIEKHNYGVDFIDDNFAEHLKSEHPNVKLINSIDAHEVSALSENNKNLYNLINIEIKNENDLIYFLKTGDF